MTGAGALLVIDFLLTGLIAGQKIALIVEGTKDILDKMIETGEDPTPEFIQSVRDRIKARSERIQNA